jgi:hypothetical protein
VEEIIDIPTQQVGSMFYRRVGTSTELWTCKHNVGYPDICEECRKEIKDGPISI